MVTVDQMTIESLRDCSPLVTCNVENDLKQTADVTGNENEQHLYVRCRAGSVCTCDLEKYER